MATKPEYIKDLEDRVGKVEVSLKEMKANDDKLFEGQSEVLKVVNSIDVCLKGDDYHPNGGLVNTVKENKKDIRIVGKRVNRIYAIGATVVTLGSLLGGYLAFWKK